MMQRLHATMTYLYAATYATPEEFAVVRRAVNRAHAPVHGEARDGQPAYNAYDPELQLWVAATLYETMMRLHDQVFGALTEEDAENVYQEFSKVATALQVPPESWPEDLAAFAEYWDRMLGELRPTEATRAWRGKSSTLAACRSGCGYCSPTHVSSQPASFPRAPRGVRHAVGRQNVAQLRPVDALDPSAVSAPPRVVASRPKEIYLKRLRAQLTETAHRHPTDRELALGELLDRRDLDQQLLRARRVELHVRDALRRPRR